MALLFRKFGAFEGLGRITQIGIRLDESKLTFRTERLRELFGTQVDHLVLNVSTPGVDSLAFGLYHALSSGLPIAQVSIEVDAEGQPIDYSGELMCSAVTIAAA